MFEYKVIPAPRTAQKAKGAKGVAGRFSATLQSALNELGAEGWSYVRAETMTVEERQGLLRKRVEDFQTVLIFSRPLAERAAPALSPDPAPETRRTVFFSPKAPETSVAPALGPATGNADAVTPRFKVDQEPEPETESEPEPESVPEAETPEPEADEETPMPAPKKPARKRAAKAKK